MAESAVSEAAVARRYDRSILDRHAASDLKELPAQLAAKVEAADWPDGLIDKVLAIRTELAEIEAWLDSGFPTAAMLVDWVEERARLLDSTLVCRQATWGDGEMLADLCAEAPERVGDWSVTVHRSPNPYAQYRLQEHPNVQVLEDQQVGLGMTASSVRNSYIDGERTSVHYMSGWRVRDGFRGLGLSKYLQNSPGPGVSWFGLVTYWYVRSGNDARSWIEKVSTDLADRPEEFGMATDQLTATVTHLRGTDQGARSARVRTATEADLPRCVELINRTHEGLDLFRPYTLEFLEERMNDPSWGPKPVFKPPVYGWEDFVVLEEGGEVIACGGLWDRGRDVREAWRHRDTEESFVLNPAALLDFGFADGEEAAVVELISHLLAETHRLGRSGMIAALEFLPAVAEACAPLGATTETREMHVMPFSMPGLVVTAVVRRPYTDLVYW